MQMSEEEIVIDYKQSKNKKMQVDILADLNVCSKDQIIEILKRNGVSSKELPRNRKKTVAEPKPEEPKQEEVKEDKQVAEPDPMQNILDCLIGKSIVIQGEILKKEKILEKITVAIGALKEAQELMEGDKGDIDA